MTFKLVPPHPIDCVWLCSWSLQCNTITKFKPQTEACFSQRSNVTVP
uniref:Uncharacterized protein n=1 Tax=Anguilla anguilla TaxID=7936 RepID=A0A0E9RKZ0_ANGAN